MRIITALIALAIPACLGSQACAGLVNVNVELELTLDTGPDALGLNGATIVLAAEFAEGTVYLDDGFGVAYVPATSHTLTISGAGVAATNGVYVDPDGLAYFPDDFGDSFFVDNLANFFFPRTPIIHSGESLQFGIALGAVSSLPSIGDFVTGSDFEPTEGFHTLATVADDFAVPFSTYLVTPSSFTSTASGSTAPPAIVPEPSSVLLFSGLGVLICWSRRRRPASA